MNRKEAVNEFREGMIKDLNPINTPNTALTDCVNGTIITYNGNEQSLQNDMGNYGLKNCKLHKNYIPIGLKEYGDILYIVSYNPLDKHMEIGSYPSPKNIIPFEKNVNSYNITSIISKISTSTPIDFKDITESYQKVIIYYGSANPEDCKINPGDMYKWNTSYSESCPFEELKYFIVDENRKLYDITEFIRQDIIRSDDDYEGPDKKTPDSDGYIHISWDVPGWFAVQPRWVTFDSFNINIKQIKVSPYGNADIQLSFNLQLDSSDVLLTNPRSGDPEDLLQYLFAKVVLKDQDGTEISSNNISFDRFTDQKNGVFTYSLSSNIQPSGISPSEVRILTIEATPFIKYDEKTITYNDFKKVMSFNVTRSGDVNEFDIGRSVWKYITDYNTIKISFDTKGLQEQDVLSENVCLAYTVTDLSNNIVKDRNGLVLSKIRLDDWSIIGNTDIELYPCEYTQTNVERTDHPLFAENVYKIKFDFYDTPNYTSQTTPLRDSIVKGITATQLLNDFRDNNFGTITFDRWFNKYPDFVKDKQISIECNATGTPVAKELTFDGGYTSWTKPSIYKKYPWFTTDDVYEPKEENAPRMTNGFNIVYSVSSDVQSTINNNSKLLVGPLWDNFIDNARAEYQSDDNNYSRGISKYTGAQTSSIISTKNSIFNKKWPYRFKDISGAIGNIWDYKLNTLKYSQYEMSFEGDFTNRGFGKGDWVLILSAIANTNCKGWDNFNKDRYREGSDEIPFRDGNYLYSLNTQFISNDILFLEITSKDIRDDSHNVRYDHLKLSSPFIDFINNDGHSSEESRYFALFNLPNLQSVAIIPIGTFDKAHRQDAVERLTDWMTHFEKISYDNDTQINGAFYTAEAKPQESTKTNSSISGALVFNSFTFLNKNLLIDEDRNYISSLLENDNFRSSGTINLNSIDLNTTEYTINGLSFNPSTIDLERMQQEVVLHNGKVVDNYDVYKSDTYLSEFTKPVTQYIHKSGTSSVPNQSTFLSIMNTQDIPTTDRTFIKAEMCHNDNGSSVSVWKTLGNTQDGVEIKLT